LIAIGNDFFSGKNPSGVREEEEEEEEEEGEGEGEVAGGKKSGK
jgi:hypothetical protein